MQGSRTSLQADERWTGSRPTGLAEAATRHPRVEVDQVPSQSPGPPLRARTAFLVAALAAAIALLGSVATEARLLGDIWRRRFARVRRAPPLGKRADLARSRTPRPRPGGSARPMRVLPAFSVLPRTVSRTPRRALAIAIATGTRARPRFRSPRGIVAFHFAMSRHREELTVSVLAVALGVGVVWFVVR